MSWRAAINRNLQSIRILACPTTAPSAAVRSWYSANYAEIKHLNPRFPFLLRPNPEEKPYMFVEYDFGKKVKIELDGLSDAEIDAKVAEAVTIGDSMPRSPHQSGEKLQLPTVTE